jgi:hypothetical protein
MDDEYEISIYKEVLAETLAGTVARYYRYAHEIDVSSDLEYQLAAQEIEIQSLEKEIGYASTMEELEVISDKLLEYNLNLNLIKMRKASNVGK